MALTGPSGSGKTYSALVFATSLADGGKVAVIDTERGSASKYADIFAFDVLELTTFHPQQYIDGIKVAEAAGYAVLVIDSLSHAWEGAGGVLELHDQATRRNGSGNSYTAWRDVTPLQRKLIDALYQANLHVIVTLRSKMEYAQTQDERGKTVIKKMGMDPIQRPGIEYEFDIVGDMDQDHNMIVSKTRCPQIADAVVNKPTAAWFATVVTWLSEGMDGSPKVVQMPGPAIAADVAQASVSQALGTAPGAVTQNAVAPTNGGGNGNGEAGCQDCGKAITGGTSASGQTFSAGQLKQQTQKMFKADLCIDCLRTRKKLVVEAAATNMGETELSDLMHKMIQGEVDPRTLPKVPGAA
jgi:hypothetical protein